MSTNKEVKNSSSDNQAQSGKRKPGPKPKGLVSATIVTQIKDLEGPFIAPPAPSKPPSSRVMLLGRLDGETFVIDPHFKDAYERLRKKEIQLFTYIGKRSSETLRVIGVNRFVVFNENDWGLVICPIFTSKTIGIGRPPTYTENSDGTLTPSCE
jgi:hypothetical protein